jgi:crossover junction endodeoxyribonuclease RuvC
VVSDGHKSIFLLGLDPGLRKTGWGVIEVESNRLRHVANGVVASGNGHLSDRLLRLHQDLTEVVGNYKLDSAAVEETFVNRDGKSTLKLGQARGVIMLVPAQAGLVVSVKKSVVGYGHADKTQVEEMVSILLPGANVSSTDAADALAVAICHAHHMLTLKSMEILK